MTSRISTIIEQIAHGNLKTLRAEQIELHAAYLLVDQAIFMWVSLVKIAQVTVHKAFPTKQLLISSAALTMLMGLKSPILVEPAQNLLSAGLILWILYLFYSNAAEHPAPRPTWWVPRAGCMRASSDEE
ncbi:MAG TPA: hypothetical protein DEF47_06140 [Herpetosiphon sp.]|uniref:Uncharacterized protein n=1 Tax=Herpetosiphon aurantiacus (strain ATCC 23779 / DSM 785 / 114-95) TaxID=316274 RepID=A9B2W8_HERA2|nr:hypothetical protein [Herpetosiphon sp.]ABX06031.1 hypothetical protein Haur_3395 [Herpetosiphon aurantiacus DSM 785]HBW49463.1 hypothetical protein [Herpetosiphon sp.]